MENKNSSYVDYHVKENSWLAKLAAKKLKAPNAAIVIGRTIYLYNTTRQQLELDDRWLKHELCHVKQFQHYGFLNFILKYLWEYLLHGYHNNKYEAEARAAETKSFGTAPA